MITGFRIGNGGATEWSGVKPDLWAFGKVIGGGLPVGAFGGSRALMEHLAPVGPVYQGGTMSGNPLACAAGLAVLERLDSTAFRELHDKASYLGAGLESAIRSAGLAVQIPVVGPLVGIFFAPTQVTNFDEAKSANTAGLYARFFHGMLSRGVALAPGAYEALFPSLAHALADLDFTINAAAEVSVELATSLR